MKIGQIGSVGRFQRKLARTRIPFDEKRAKALMSTRASRVVVIRWRHAANLARKIAQGLRSRLEIRVRTRTSRRDHVVDSL